MSQPQRLAAQGCASAAAAYITQQPPQQLLFCFSSASSIAASCTSRFNKRFRAPALQHAAATRNSIIRQCSFMASSTMSASASNREERAGEARQDPGATYRKEGGLCQAPCDESLDPTPHLGGQQGVEGGLQGLHAGEQRRAGAVRRRRRRPPAQPRARVPQPRLQRRHPRCSMHIQNNTSPPK